MALRVLVADETPNIQSLFQQALEQSGLAVQGLELRSVRAGDEVLAIVESWQPNIVFVDVLLPHKSGYEVAEELATHPALSQLPVVLTYSGFVGLDEVQYQQSGARACIEKPFDESTLSSRLLEWLGPAQEGTPDKAAPEGAVSEGGEPALEAAVPVVAAAVTAQEVAEPALEAEPAVATEEGSPFTDEVFGQDEDDEDTDASSLWSEEELSSPGTQVQNPLLDATAISSSADKLVESTSDLATSSAATNDVATIDPTENAADNAITNDVVTGDVVTGDVVTSDPVASESTASERPASDWAADSALASATGDDEDENHQDFEPQELNEPSEDELAAENEFMASTKLLEDEEANSSELENEDDEDEEEEEEEAADDLAMWVQKDLSSTTPIEEDTASGVVRLRSQTVADKPAPLPTKDSDETTASGVSTSSAFNDLDEDDDEEASFSKTRLPDLPMILSSSQPTPSHLTKSTAVPKKAAKKRALSDAEAKRSAPSKQPTAKQSDSSKPLTQAQQSRSNQLRNDQSRSNQLRNDQSRSNQSRSEFTQEVVKGIDLSAVPDLDEQIEKAVHAQAKKIIEQVVWKVVPELAGRLIEKELNRLLQENEGELRVEKQSQRA